MTDAPAIAIADPIDQLRRAQQGKGYWKRVWERLRRDKLTLAMAAILIALLVMVVFAPWFTAYDPYQGSVLRRLKPVGVPGHWLGTHEGGRDLWTRMVYGGRPSFVAGGGPGLFALAAGLSFLGLGVTPPSAEWGLMLNNLRQAIWVDPVICALPGVMIFITSMCFNLLSDGLRQAMDVRL